MSSAAAAILRQNIRRQGAVAFKPTTFTRHYFRNCEKYAKPTIIDQRRYNSAFSKIFNTYDRSVPKPTGPTGSSTPYTQKTETVTSTQEEGQSMWAGLSQNLEETTRYTRQKQAIDPDQAWRMRSEIIQQHIKSSMQAPPGSNILWYGFDDIGTGVGNVPTVSSGRTVTASNFATAVRRLDVILGRNRVKAEWRRDKFFEKPARRRYRLRSQRHRRRFAAMVREKVKIVQAIRRRGM